VGDEEKEREREREREREKEREANPRRARDLEAGLVFLFFRSHNTPCLPQLRGERTRGTKTDR
jgi:hypothetical protein